MSVDPTFFMTFSGSAASVVSALDAATAAGFLASVPDRPPFDGEDDAFITVAALFGNGDNDAPDGWHHDCLRDAQAALTPLGWRLRMHGAGRPLEATYLATEGELVEWIARHRGGLGGE